MATATLKPTTASQPVVFLTPPATKAQLWNAVRLTFGVRIPTEQVCDDHVAPMDAFAHAYFAEDPVTIWKASRGFGGKSFMLALLVNTEAVFLPASSTIVGGSFQQSLNVHEHTNTLWEYDYAPSQLLSVPPTMTQTTLTNGAHIRALTASQKSVRGPHPQRLRMDEIDEMELAILEGAQGQPMGKMVNGRWIEAQTVMSSTHQYPDGTMSEMLSRAGDLGWPVHHWCLASGSLVLTDRGYVPIEEVRCTDSVATRYGWREVQHVTFMGHKPTMSIAVDGRELHLTPDHQVLTTRGWVEAVALTGMGDNVEVLRADAPTITTQVINDVIFGHRPNHVQPHPLMSGHGGLASVIGMRGLEPVAVAFGVRPIEAVSKERDESGVHGNTARPVWDIGVHGAHEFVAEGVVVHNCYRESMGTRQVPGWLRPRQVMRKRQEVHPRFWAVEYELQAPSFEGRAIESELVDIMFRPPSVVDNMGDEIIFEQPVQGRQYITGVDWAKEKDWTIIWTFDPFERPWKTVAWLRVNKTSWPIMVDKACNRVLMYPGVLVHDATGVGNVVADLLTIPRRHSKVIDRKMVGRDREIWFNEYIAGVEEGELSAPRIEFAYYEHLYCRRDDLFKRSGHPPDSFVAGTMAWSARNSLRPNSGIKVKGDTRSTSPWRLPNL